MSISKNRREYEESFNIFRNLNLIEDTHSALLKKIIHPRGKHGKKDAILRIFFELRSTATF
ncbi:MAG: PD-(D/E)XK nuclease family protein [Bacteroidales bacterium]